MRYAFTLFLPMVPAALLGVVLSLVLRKPGGLLLLGGLTVLEKEGRWPADRPAIRVQKDRVVVGKNSAVYRWLLGEMVEAPRFEFRISSAHLERESFAALRSRELRLDRPGDHTRHI